jgi:hypothetical protein
VIVTRTGVTVTRTGVTVTRTGVTDGNAITTEVTGVTEAIGPIGATGMIGAADGAVIEVGVGTAVSGVAATMT